MSQLVTNKTFPFKWSNLLNYSGYLVFLIITLFFSLSTDTFFSWENLMNILVQASSLGILACGITAILMAGGNDVIRGGMDLSIANNLAFCVAVMAGLLTAGYSLPFAIGMALITSIAVGVLNALLVVPFKVIPLLATLAVMYLLQGAELLITKNTVMHVDILLFQYIANGTIANIPVPIIIFGIVAITMYFIFHQTSYGNWVHATGGNPEAARNAGIRVGWVIASTYIIAGLLVVIAALLVIGRVGGSVPGMGNLMLLDVLLAGLLSTIFSRLAVPNIQGAILRDRKSVV